VLFLPPRAAQDEPGARGGSQFKALEEKEAFMATISAMAGGIISIAFGLLVIVWPRLLRWAVGAWFIIAGIIAIVNALE
jgi:uncharacterized membrane protein HdeD (DUF308 family)